MTTFKVIIAGGRYFNDYELMKEKVSNILSTITDLEIIIISGTANGADKLGERFAKEHGYTVEQYPAQWDKYGKSAGYKRNEQMAKLADASICFWDGKSRGTKHMIDLSKKHGLKSRIVFY